MSYAYEVGTPFEIDSKNKRSKILDVLNINIIMNAYK